MTTRQAELDLFTGDLQECHRDRRIAVAGARGQLRNESTICPRYPCVVTHSVGYPAAYTSHVLAPDNHPTHSGVLPSDGEVCPAAHRPLPCVVAGKHTSSVAHNENRRFRYSGTSFNLAGKFPPNSRSR